MPRVWQSHREKLSIAQPLNFHSIELIMQNFIKKVVGRVNK